MLRVVGIVAVLLIPTLAGAGVLALLRVHGVAASRWRDWRWRRTPAATVSLERLVTDLRRLRLELQSVEDSPSQRSGRGVRMRALRAAYVDALLATCRVVEVPDLPSEGSAIGTAEVYRLERGLLDRGVDARTPVVR